MKISRLLKPLAWFAAAVAALPLLCYLALVVVNLRDRPPAPEALAYARQQAQRPPLADADNAWIFMLGLGTQRGSDPARDGAVRAAWIQRQLASPLFDPRGDPLPTETNFRDTLSEISTTLSKNCNQGGGDCLLALQGNPHGVQDWLRQERWLLDRYQQLLRYRQWQEPRPWDFMAPFPSYGATTEGQKLHLASALLLARQGQARAASELLEADARFWLMVLESADTLVTKLIAASNIMRNMGWTSLVARELPPATTMSAIPPAWRQPLPRHACSLQQVMAGEWAVADRLVRRMDIEWREAEFLQLEPAAVWRERIGQFLERPLWQEQDTSNDIARHHLAVGLAFNSECGHVGAALAHWRQQSSGSAKETSWFQPYNPIYRINNSAAPDYGEYAARLGDLEAMRRALLVTVALREAGITTAGVPAALAASPLRNPVDGSPFLWDEASGSITFRPLAEDRRQWYRYPY